MREKKLSEEELRTRVAKRLTEDVPDPLWEYLKDDDEQLFEQALWRGEAELQDLVRVARSQLRLFKEMQQFIPSSRRPRNRPAETEVDTVSRSSREEERSEAFSEYLALVAGVDEGVLRFRQKVLGRKLLEAEQAYHFVSSPAAARYQVPWFKKRKIPVVDHRWTIEEERWGVDNHGLYVVTTFTVDPPGITRRVKKHKDYELFWGSADLIKRLERQRARRSEYKNDEKHYSYGELATLKFPYKETPRLVNEIPVFPGSILNELRELSEELSNSLCYPWREEEAAWFVLTDEAPTSSGIDAKVVKYDNHAFSYGTINLSVEPWVSKETVLQTYQDLQRKILGHRNRPISRRNAAVFKFVVGRLRSRIKKQLWQKEDVGPDSWRRRLNDWNALHPEGDDWHYEDSDGGKAVRHFQRDCEHRALPKVARPHYTLPRNDEARHGTSAQ